MRLVIMVLFLSPIVALGAPTYCAQNAKYIDVGATKAQVIEACGEPMIKEQSRRSATMKVPVQQLIYTALNTGNVYPTLNSVFYDQWSLPSGTQGIGLIINVQDNKVSGIQINGNSSNAMNLCQETSIKIGDSLSAVYNACGSPSMVNQSYINVPVPGNPKPELWVYELNPYQPAMRLTFVNEKLEFID